MNKSSIKRTFATQDKIHILLAFAESSVAIAELHKHAGCFPFITFEEHLKHYPYGRDCTSWSSV